MAAIQMVTLEMNLNVPVHIQKFRLDQSGIEEAVRQLREGKLRYRAVLEASEPPY